MKKSAQRGLAAQAGFTLIELLVVIAIIGLLAAVVLAAVGSARNKGTDTAVKGQLNSARSQAELYYSGNTSTVTPGYQGVCAAAGTATPPGMGGAAGPGILKNAAAPTGATAAVNAIGTGTTATCNDSATAWAMEAPLTGSTNAAPKMWCVDSTGASLAESTKLVAATTTVCPIT